MIPTIRSPSRVSVDRFKHRKSKNRKRHVLQCLWRQCDTKRLHIISHTSLLISAAASRCCIRNPMHIVSESSLLLECEKQLPHTFCMCEALFRVVCCVCVSPSSHDRTEKYSIYSTQMCQNQHERSRLIQQSAVPDESFRHFRGKLTVNLN